MGRNSRITVLDSPCRQFPSFLLFMFAFISVLDILCLPASLPLGAAGLHNRLAGPLFLIQRGKKKKEEAVHKSVAISDGSTPGYCQIVTFSKALLSQINYLQSEITSIAAGCQNYCYYFSLSNLPQSTASYSFPHSSESTPLSTFFFYALSILINFFVSYASIRKRHKPQMKMKWCVPNSLLAGRRSQALDTVVLFHSIFLNSHAAHSRERLAPWIRWTLLTNFCNENCNWFSMGFTFP